MTDNKCKFSDIVSITFGHNGGVLISKYSDLKVTIPEGAIRDGDLVTLSVASDLYGPFVLPSKCQADVVSPYYWIGVSGSYHFYKSVQVEFQHFAVVTACDPSHYQLLCCDDESYTMQPVDYELSFIEQDEKGYCTFTANHFCSYCLHQNCNDPMINRIGAFYLKPENFQDLDQFIVEIWFSFPIGNCLKRNEELYRKRGMILDCSHIFEASCDKNSTNYFTLHYNKGVTGWYVGHSRSTEIPTKDVNFYNYYTNAADLIANEEKLLFPPRFIVNVARSSQCTMDLYTNLNVVLRDYDVEVNSISFITFNLSILLSTKASMDSSRDSSLFFIDSHHCEDNKPNFKDLELYLEHISSDWKEIAIHLGISKLHISTINIDHLLVKDKCNEMLKVWLEQTTSPCWCHFVEALIDCRLLDVAEEAKKHLQKSTSNVTMGSPDTGKDLHMKDKLCVDDHGRASVVALDNLKVPTATGTDTAAETDNQFTVNDLMQVSADLEAVCPLKDSEVMLHTCDYNGGILMSKDGSIKITVPKGAIRRGDLVMFATATDLFASFILPSKCYTSLASPYYWIGVTGLYHFQVPVEVVFQHFGACDPSHYQLLCCEDDDESYTMQPVDYELSFKLQGGTLWCTFQALQLCSYCLHHGCSDPMINKIGVYYLKPKNFHCLDFFTVEIWFSFPISHCSERNRKLFSNRNMILDAGCSYIFEASCEESSGTYFSLEYAEKVDGWQIDHSLSKKIPTKRVNFYKYYTSAAELEASEEDSSFPPRFIVNVVKNYDCTTNLNTNIIVTLHNNEDNESIKFKLFVPLSMTAQSFTSETVTNTKDSKKQTSPSPNINYHHCDNNRPKLTDLVKYKTNISARWKEIALNLGIPEDKVSTINTDNPNVADKCYDMFKMWLDTTVSACWCHLIQALCARDVSLHKVAEEVKLHLKYDSTSTASPGINYDLHQLTMFLKDIPERKLNYFITRILPKASAATVIKDIRSSRGSKEDNINKVCEEFLKQEDPSMTKIHRALKEAECDDLADYVEMCFL